METGTALAPAVVPALEDRAPAFGGLPGVVGSETIGRLAEALAKAQGAMRAAAKDAENPHYRSRYADLASVWDAARAALAANGLAVLQPVDASGNAVRVSSILTHASGEWIAAVLTFTIGQASPQAVGSAITYGRRYGLASLIGVVADEDDDGNAASLPANVHPRTGEILEPPARRARRANATERTEGPRPTPADPPAVSSSPSEPDGHPSPILISDKQRKRLFAIARQAGWTDEQLRLLLRDQGFASSGDVTSHRYDAIVALVERGPEPPAF